MTPEQQKYLDHCIRMALIDKAYAWNAAKKYEELYPAELSDLPALLTAAMLKRQANDGANQRVWLGAFGEVQ